MIRSGPSVSPCAWPGFTRHAVASCLSFALFLAVAAPSWADVPATIRTQGHLATAAGTPAEGSILMTFRLYDAPVGGNLVWEETQAVVASGGAYDARLGADVPLGFALDNPVYLSVAIAGGAELSPRRLLASAAYALSARRAQSAAPGSVTAATLDIPCATGQVLAFASAGWGCGTPSCGSGTTACGATCTNLRLDAANCGACGNACPSGQACVAGSCN